MFCVFKNFIVLFFMIYLFLIPGILIFFISSPYFSLFILQTLPKLLFFGFYITL